MRIKLSSDRYIDSKDLLLTNYTKDLLDVNDELEKASHCISFIQAKLFGIDEVIDEIEMLRIIQNAFDRFGCVRSSKDMEEIIKGKLSVKKDPQSNNKVFDYIESLDKLNTADNANKDCRLISTRRDLIAGEIYKQYALENILPEDIAKAHEDGDIHYHDLDYSPTGGSYNCMLIDFEGMLKNGFTIGEADVESPHGIQTAVALITQIIANVSSNMYGGTSFHRAEETLEPYAQKTFAKLLVKYIAMREERDKLEVGSLLVRRYGGNITVDNLAIKRDYNIAYQYAVEDLEKIIYDCMQGLEYEINTLYNSNGQTPFFTLNFGLGDNTVHKMIQKAILNVRLKGLGKKGKTAVFPKLVFTLKKGHNVSKGDPFYDVKQLALECASKRMYPDILSYEKVVEIHDYFVSPMGCRSFLNKHMHNGEYRTNGGMNLGVVTLNLPRIGIESKGDLGCFLDLLDQRLDLCYRALMTRIESLENTKAENAPILYMYGATGHRMDKDEYVRDIFKNGYASVSLGWIGMYETMVALFGVDDWYQDQDLVRFSQEILKQLHRKCEAWKEETGYAFSVYSSPSETLTDTLCRKDLAKFGEIENITDKGYYTNSFHYDVRKDPTPFEKLEFESKYIPYTKGGNICYVEVPNLQKNLMALESIWDYACEYVPYFGVNQPIDKCYKCNYEGEFNLDDGSFMCPNCGNTDYTTTTITRRLCGYLGNLNSRKPVEGRIKEIDARVKHMGN